VGVGNYLAGTASNLTLVSDPHDVILLEAAEGGYIFAASFILLVVGAAFVLFRLRRVELAAAAGGVLIATVAHGMVDVYWVRGTPVLGWLLVGMVCGLAAQRKADAPALDTPA
jgi:ABC-type amino acid transport system permease subunit